MNGDDVNKVCEEAYAKYGYEPFDRISLVVDKAGTPTHYCESQLFETVEKAERLDLSMMLSGDTTALSAVKLFETSERSIAFVLHENRISGVLFGGNFFKPEFSICVLAMLLEVERTCLEVALRDAESSWMQLGPGRQAKAREVFALRHKTDSEGVSKERLLHCTTFIDKQKLIQNAVEAVKLGKSWLGDFFKEMEQYRNHFAHAGEESYPGGVRGLAKLIGDMERFVALFTPPAESAIRLVR